MSNSCTSQQFQHLCNMFNMRHKRFWEDDDVFEANQGELSFYACKYNIHCSLKHLWCALQTKWQFHKAIKFLLRRDCGFMLNLFFILCLPIPAVGTKSGEDGPFTEGVNTFSHPWDGVWVPSGKVVEFPIVDAETEKNLLVLVQRL